MSVVDNPEYDQHETIHHFEDPVTGLKGIIAIHSTALGPAAGGCRRWHYIDEEAALTDAMRLSRGMTYKNAVAGLPFGGGKAVIMANDHAPKTPELFAAFGRAIASLNGRYITAEDVGVAVDDMRHVQEVTPFVSGLPQSGGSAGGDPGPWTALGVYLGIEAAAKDRLELDSVKDLRVAIQGVGSVGLQLARLLKDAGAEIFVADVNQDNLDRALKEVGATVVEPDKVLSSDVDILSPCALGNILTAETIPHIKAKIVAGAANNQLGKDSDGALLTARDILYAPDYVINGGGIISVAREYLGQSSEEEVRAEVCHIPERLHTIFKKAKATGQPTDKVANALARQIVASGSANNISPAVNC